MLPLSTGNVLLAGSFTSAGGNDAQRIVRWNPTTGAWSPVEIGFPQMTINEYIRAMVETSSGDYIIGGRFARAGDATVTNIVRVDSMTDAWLSIGHVGATSGSAVNDLLKLANGRIIVSGSFTSAGGVAAQGIAQYDPETNVWTALGSSPFSAGATKAIQLPSGDLLVVGWYPGPSASSIMAKWSFATNTWTSVPISMTPFCVSWPHGVQDCAAYFSTMAMLESGDIMFGGTYLSAGPGGDWGVSRAVLGPSLLWNPTGTYPITRMGLVMALSSGDAIGLGEIYLQPSQYPPSSIARWSPRSNRWTDLGAGLQMYLGCAAILPNGELLVGGGGSAGILLSRARLAASRLDYDCDGRVSVQDVLAYINTWLSGAAAADFNLDGAVGVADLLDYIAAWFAGE